MQQKEILKLWIDAFNRADVEALAALYSEDATNHQVAESPVRGRDAIRRMFTTEFAAAGMVCVVENMFQDGEWAIMEWRDPKGLRGSGFFQVINDKIVYQRSYWDKLTFLKLNSLPLPGTAR